MAKAVECLPVTKNTQDALLIGALVGAAGLAIVAARSGESGDALSDDELRAALENGDIKMEDLHAVPAVTTEESLRKASDEDIERMIVETKRKIAGL